MNKSSTIIKTSKIHKNQFLQYLQTRNFHGDSESVNQNIDLYRKIKIFDIKMEVKMVITPRMFTQR